MASGRQLLRALPLRLGLPCITSAFTAPADVERCLTVLAFHIDSGQVEGVDVNGLTVGMFIDAPRVMADGNWRVGLFMAPGPALLALAAAGWIYVIYHAGSARSTATGGLGAGAVFPAGWTAMMTAMMVSATLPLILIYRTIARSQLSPAAPRPA